MFILAPDTHRIDSVPLSNWHGTLQTVQANEIATWATIVGPLVALAAFVVATYVAIAPAINSHQRKLRGEFRGVIKQILDACRHFESADERSTAVGILEDASRKLADIVSEGLLSPSAGQVSAFRRALDDLAETEDEMPTGTKPHTPTTGRQSPLDVVRAALDGAPRPQSKRQKQLQYVTRLSLEYHQATVDMDNGNIAKYYRYRRVSHPAIQNTTL